MSHESSNFSPRMSRNTDKKLKNPYSERGLDKFSALLTDLEQKRQKIYSKTDPQNIVLLRFAYKNSDECVPVVVKHRHKKEDKPTIEKIRNEASTSQNETKRSILETQKNVGKSKQLAVNLKRWSRPSYYLSAIVIFILLLLSEFGRTVTILCTSLLWYLIPVVKQTSKSRTSTNRKCKNLIRNKMVA